MILSRLRIAVGLLTIVPALPGCIAWEIHDEVRSANQRIDEVDGMLIGTADRLDSTNERISRTIELLEGVHTSIQQTNSQLAEVQTLLRQTDEHMVGVTGVIEATNPVLTTANTGLDRLQILNEIQKSLDDISVALVPLQNTMAGLSGAMSFLGMGGEETPVAAAPDEPAAEQDENPAAGAPGASTDDTRRLMGTWILAHPPEDTG